MRRIGAAARDTVATQLDPATVAGQRIATFARLQQQGRRLSPVSPWIRAFFGVDAAAPVDAAFLDQLSIRDISKYLGRRVGGKLLGRAAPAGHR